MRLKFLFLPAALALAACDARAADAPVTPISAVTDLASLLEGEFTTASSPGDPPSVAAPSGRVLYDLAKRVDVPALGHDIIYAELREGAPDGKLLRQSLYALTLDTDTDRITMTVYDIANQPALSGAYADPSALARLGPSDVKQRRDGCSIAWHPVEGGFEGKIQPDSCKPHQSAEIDPPDMAVSKTGLAQRLGLDGAGRPTVFHRLR